MIYITNFYKKVIQKEPFLKYIICTVLEVLVFIHKVLTFLHLKIRLKLKGESSSQKTNLYIHLEYK